MSAGASGLRLERREQDESATMLELFFDLVFVFALTQVTAFMAKDLDPLRLTQGLLILGLLWWSWVGYAWLGNVIRADEGGGRLALLGAMGAMFVIALAIPEAFDDAPGGWSAPYAIATGYFVLRAIHIGTFWLAAAGDRGLRRQLLRFAASMLLATSLLMIAGGVEDDARTWLWVAALAADYVGTYAGGASGWRLASATHFAERHSLIIIIALGESIVAVGVGVSERPFSGAIVLAALLGLTLTAALWWMYFDTSSLLAERALATCPEDRRPRLARDAYSFLHLPMMAGIVLLALGMKKVLEYVSDTEEHDLDDPLTGVALAALVLGVSIYLAGQVAFIARCGAGVRVHRLVLALAVVPLALLGEELPAMATLALLAGVLTATVAWESWRFAAARHEVRHAPHHYAHPSALPEG
ncbi:MAG: low temperature requirement protein A [Sporichthyaceae bacterium]